MDLILKKTTNYIEVTEHDLPLACPMHVNFKHMHPRVYLPVQQEGTVICPYCNTRYTFINKNSANKE
jgi:uncharacterized Zn-finger protein